jgi:hypothetical protein
MLAFLALAWASAFGVEYQTPTYLTPEYSASRVSEAPAAQPTGVNIVPFGSTGVLTTDMNGIHVIVPNAPVEQAAAAPPTGLTCNCQCPPAQPAPE